MKFLEAKIDSLQDVLVLEAGYGAQVAAVEANVTAALAGWKGALLEGKMLEAGKFAASLTDSVEQAEDLLAIKSLADAFRAGLVVTPPAEVPAPAPIEPAPVG